MKATTTLALVLTVVLFWVLGDNEATAYRLVIVGCTYATIWVLIYLLGLSIASGNIYKEIKK